MIPVTNPYNNWQGDNSTTKFDFDFLVENQSQLLVFVTAADKTVRQLTYETDYTITGFGNNNGGYITYPINEENDKLQNDETITLQLVLPVTQQSEYGTSSELNPKDIEHSLDYLTRIAQIQNRQLERSVKVAEGSGIDTEKLVNSVNTIYENIDVINAVNNNKTNINAVNDNAANINTVANSIENVNTVGNNIANVNAVVSNETNINAVNDNATNINTVANSIENVNTVGNDIAIVNAVATNINNINTVAGVSGNVTTVANKIGNVNTVAINIQAVDNCSDNMDAIKEAPDYAQFAADCLASCQSIKGQFSLVSFLSGGSSANILQEDIYDGGSSSVLSENVYSGGNSEYKNVLTYDDIKNVHEITALQALVKTLVNRIEALENIKTISGGVAVA